MIRKISREEIKELTSKTFLDEINKDEIYLLHSVEVDTGMCVNDNHIWSHSNDLELLKDLYQNVVLREFFESLFYYEAEGYEDLDLNELIALKEHDLGLDTNASFKEFKEILKFEPMSFDELKAYVKRTSELLDNSGFACGAMLFDSFDDVFNQMIEDYCGEFPVFETELEYIKDSSYQ